MVPPGSLSNIAFASALEKRYVTPSCTVKVSGFEAILLVADHNTDMRAYLARLLAARWNVTAVEDGQAAFDAALRSPPDLVLHYSSSPPRWLSLVFRLP